ncbi:uncharacterized protein LOC109543977 [Dendroctonus ponderosae]|uniref:uncharacterized protein LOC109543977 n=1 Tax=Dendroctonus ponderosae TaxID=77166 RepID=UPI0020359026|nr:uncharacterized protein LOC109543977 [Dendroctonus ponderosae]KAH1012267.1 hypothetical protein HUJ05_011450 [Dendroctonus ponderosae]
MLKRKSGSRSEDDVRSQKSHYTNASKIGSVPSRNLELSLEVELDDEVRSIIRNPDKCASALLDVTVIKPKGLEDYTSNTQTLRTEQVKKMIGSMQLNHGDKKLLMEKLFGMGNGEVDRKPAKPKRGASAKETRKKSCLSPKSKHLYKDSLVSLEQGDVRCVTDESNSAVFSMYKQKKPKKAAQEIPNSKLQHIYTTPRTYENLRTMFACQKNEADHDSLKMDAPCLCQNCAIVGVLTDSQKKPFATEAMPHPKDEEEARLRRAARKKSVSFKSLKELASSPHHHDQCEAIYKVLSTRISELEKRLMMQEQRAVPKDYFKKIITKLVTHLSKLTHYTTEEKTLSQRDKDYLAQHSRMKSGAKSSKFHVNPVLVGNSFKIPAEKEYEPKPCSSSEPPRGPSEVLWKWGEEVLLSGRDLKNKVVYLLEETLRNLRKGFEKPQSSHRCEEDIQSIVDELSKNLAETVRMSSARSRDARRSRSKHHANNLCKQRAEHDRKSAKPSMIPRYHNNKRLGPSINVAYINPQLTKWPEESSVSFKIDASDYDSHRETMTEARKNQYKREFYKVLESTKRADRFKLWQNIWNQAVENRQGKSDTVSIQIPDPKDLLRQKMIHLEYTIGELEHLLLKDDAQC